MNENPNIQMPAEPPVPPAIIHDYAMRLPARPPPADHLLAVATACALSGLGSGLLCFIGWVVTRWDGFATIGLVSVGFGTILCVVGVSCVFAHYVATVSRRFPSVYQWLPTRRQLLTLLLLTINFPIAVGLAYAVKYIDSFYVVTINE